ncbi:MAG TPA: class III extradiol ring-cleavage dioxygenase, partial [Polyangiaceae bacterium]|nr:class III extradiol ring-cleavage dioxygenase [Polyangiaceae bacterium]
MTPEEPSTVTRRQAIAAGLVATVGAGAVATQVHGSTSSAEASGRDQRVKSPSRLPVVYLPHGGGPWPFVEMGIGTPAELDLLREYLSGIGNLPNNPIKALLVISAHWEEPVPTLMNGEHPPMLYDYYGFPPESYEVQWPAPGHPELAERIASLLEQNGFQTQRDPKRGYDHGTFVPLKLAFPAADVPTVQLSLVRGLKPEEHLRLGQALQPLRDEGVFIIGSGMSYHNLRAFGPAGRPVAQVFDAWLQESATLPAQERNERLRQWSNAPSARLAHPREEHL